MIRMISRFRLLSHGVPRLNRGILTGALSQRNQRTSSPVVANQPGGCVWSRATSNDAAKIGGFSYPAPRKLADITKIQLLEKHSSARVSEIWKEYHATHKTSIADVLSESAYDMLKNRTTRCPLFVLPVGREQGFFTLIVQFQGRQVLLTFLEDYKRNAAGAMPYLTITFFEELLARKHIALMRADVTNMMTRPEAEK